MRKSPDSMLGALALLGVAASVAYLSPKREPALAASKEPSSDKREPAPAGSKEPSSDKNASVPDALASDRGRHAETPTDIPAKGWKDVIWRTYEQINEDRLLAVAAGVVFYGLLALFPAVTALVSLYALIADSNTVNEHIAFLGDFLPQGSFTIIQDQVARVLSKGDIKLGGALIVSLLLAIWSANGGMKAIIDALNVVYDEKEKRGFFKLNAVSLAFTVGGVLAILIAIGLVIGAPVILTFIGLESSTDLILRIGRWPLLALLVLLALAVLYRYGPSRRSPKWRWISVGSVTATVTWIAGSALLSFYLVNFGNYDATYGSLGAAIAMMMWMWMSTIVILFGAELNSEIEHQTTADSTAGGAKPLGSRGAKMADTVGASR